MSTLERIYRTPVGKGIARKAGLKDPPRLRRGRTWPDGAIVIAPIADSTLVKETVALLRRPSEAPIVDVEADTPPAYGDRIGALVVDALGLTTIGQLEDLRAVLRPAVRGMERSGRIVIVASAHAGDWQQHAVTQALDGITRTVAKELRGGATANLLFVDDAVTAADLASTLAFLLQGRSAFVAGQSWHVKAARTADAGVTERPLDGKTIVVTGAARGIGAAIARTLARDGASILGVDMPAAGESLAQVMNEVGGTALQLDITAPEAGVRIAERVAALGTSIHGIVHNAGITRDKMLVNTDRARWGSVLEVNLAAQMRINDRLLDADTAGGLAEGGRIVGVASTSGIAGNKGQANYAASKAGVAGLVRAMARDLSSRGITANAVAPGFIETEMTGRIPFVQREIFRRANSLSQGGDPVDVAETIGYLLDPASGGVNGQVLRVCGQNIVGQ